MSIHAGTAADIAKASAAPNPANQTVKRASDVDRVPMDMPNLKLAVPQLEGFYLYWHLGKNVSRAMRHGYAFVEADEVDIEQTGIANDREASGSTDLGTRVSISAGQSGEAEEERLYLMKLPLELHEKDMELKTQRNEDIAVQLRAGLIGAGDDPDRNKRYMKDGQHLFYPKAKR